MTRKVIRDIPLNRVEGDMEIRVEFEGNRIVDAWSAGTMYRGFENMMVGRGPLDGLVITPRICGICSTTHLMAAAQALDQIAAVAIPDNAIRLRNLTLMVEHCQGDIRQSVLMFLPDFASDIYQSHPLHAEAVRRYSPLQGQRCIDVVRQTKSIIEIIAILGGQWPHSSFMVPGGVTYVPPVTELNQCRHLLGHYRRWYEQSVLGCTLERWQAVQSASDLAAWLAENPDHRESDIGFFLRFAREAGLHEMGLAHGNFISYGSLNLPSDTSIASTDNARQLVSAGFIAQDGKLQRFDQAGISEHVAASWYADYPGGNHPFAGRTEPQATGTEGSKYSWCKAPRYLDQPAETGPLAERIIGNDPLFCDLLKQEGGNLVVRQLARLTRPATLLPAMATWLDEMIARHDEPYYTAVAPLQEGRGYGLIEAARGGLGHWVEIAEGRITRYQIVTPTSWNGSPRDSAGVRGPWEQALVGTTVKDIDNPVEAGHVVRSFDPCLVCSVHVVGADRTPFRF